RLLLRVREGLAGVPQVVDARHSPDGQGDHHESEQYEREQEPRRAASPTTCRATTSTALMSLPQKAQEAFFERFVLRLNRIHARAGGDHRADELRDPFAIDAFDDDGAVRAVVELAELGHGPTGL